MEGADLGRYGIGSTLIMTTGMIPRPRPERPVSILRSRAQGMMTVPRSVVRSCDPFTRAVAAATAEGPVAMVIPVVVVATPPCVMSMVDSLSPTDRKSVV